MENQLHSNSLQNDYSKSELKTKTEFYHQGNVSNKLYQMIFTNILVAFRSNIISKIYLIEFKYIHSKF